MVLWTEDWLMPPTETLVQSAIESSWSLPTWGWILFSVLAFTFALFIYAKERGTAKIPERGLLVAIRFALLFLTLWMLTGWYWFRYETDRPTLAIVIDTSASMDTSDALGPDDQVRTRLATIENGFANLDESSKQRLNEQYAIQWFSVSDHWETLSSGFLQDSATPWEATGETSRLGENLIKLIDQRAGESAIVLFLSDGINTAGVGLEEAAKAAHSAAIPVYALSVGRDFALPDLRLSDLRVEPNAYLGDRVTVELSAVAINYVTGDSRIALIDLGTGEALDKKTLTLDPSQPQRNIRLDFVPKRSGKMRLAVEARPLPGETDLGNNRLEKDLTVQNKTIRVMLVQGQPTYEFRFLKHFLERSQQVGEEGTKAFELVSVLQASDSEYVSQDPSAIRLVPSNRERLEQVDVFVFGSFDPSLVSRRAQQIIYDTVTQQGAGCLFLWGRDSAHRELQGWPLGDLLPIRTDSLGLNSAASRGAMPSELVSWRWQPTTIGESALPLLLDASEATTQETWNQLPPVQNIASIKGLKPAAQVLAQAVNLAGGGENRPLLVSQFAGSGRSVLQLTDETFRWTSFQGNDTYHQRYWGQLLRWASRGKLRQQEESSRLTIEPQQIQTGQPLHVTATVGSSTSIEDLPNSARVSVTNEKQLQQTIRLSQSVRDNRRYTAQVPQLPAGQYTALLVQPNADPPPSVEFTVSEPPGEQYDLRADITTMQSLARISRGKSYRPHEFEKMLQELPRGSRNRLGTLPPIPLWNSWWIAVAFVLLITAEWLLRRKYRML